MLTKEKVKRTETRQDDYEGICIYISINFLKEFVPLFIALFSLKKNVKEYQKRLLLLENASFDNRKSVS